MHSYCPCSKQCRSRLIVPRYVYLCSFHGSIALFVSVVDQAEMNPTQFGLNQTPDRQLTKPFSPAQHHCGFLSLHFHFSLHHSHSHRDTESGSSFIVLLWSWSGSSFANVRIYNSPQCYIILNNLRCRLGPWEVIFINLRLCGSRLVIRKITISHLSPHVSFLHLYCQILNKCQKKH